MNVGGEGNGEVGGAFHFALEDFGGGACLILTNLDDQLVVDLKNETGIQTALTERAIYGKHGELDHVGGGALNGTVHGDAFAERHKLRALTNELHLREAMSKHDWGVETYQRIHSDDTAARQPNEFVEMR